MRKKWIQVTSLSLASLMLLSGCGNVYDYSKIPYPAELTKQEVVDYYTEQMSYETIVKRSASKLGMIEWNAVPDVLSDKLWQKTLGIIETHQLNTGYDADMLNDVHEYLKLTIDDLVLMKPLKQGSSSEREFTYKQAESRGYYFVTVSFDTKLNGHGTLKSNANYLGINGVIVQDENGNPRIDTGFLQTALNKMNEYRQANGQEQYKSYGLDLNYVPETQVEETQAPLPDIDAEGNRVVGSDVETQGETNTETQPSETETQPETQPTMGETEADYTYAAQENGETPYRNSYANNVRKLEYDVTAFNTIVGTSKEQIAAIPYLGMLYNPVEPSGEIAGYGVYSEGDYGLRDFGYDRSKYTDGKMEITFVFKQDSDNRDEFEYSYCYINNYTSNISMEDKQTTVSSYIEEELDKIIERADRAVNNADSSALMSQNIFEASDLGLKYSLLRNSSNVLSFMTKRIGTLDRQNKSYLVELERTVEESPKGFGNTARYKDKYYAVIRQVNTSFKINDLVWVSRELERIPEPNADDSITRRLTSLNLAGEVTEQSQNEIKEMLNNLYTASTYRILYDKKENDGIVVKDNIPQYGMYDRFDSDTALLSSDRKEYLNSQIRARLTKNGTNVKCSLQGKTAEWLGGYNDQVELVTEELYTYDGIDKGVYVNNYYLVSHYGTEWVIDDIVAIEEKDVEGEELAQLKQSILEK